MNTKLLLLAPLALGALGTLTGCTRDGKFQPVDMWNGSRLRPYEGFHFFPNNSEAQVPPSGTVARGANRTNEPLYYGTQNGTLVTYNPLVQSVATPQEKLSILQRGQERYQIYCQPCHGLGGYGDGLIVKRGMSAPPSYHEARLLDSADGHLYDVIANGYGSMYSYGSRVPTKDRWAIVAYIRALQLSQSAPASSVPPGVDLKTPQVVPPINNERKYIGPAGGGAYHDSGLGNEPNVGANPGDTTNFGGLGKDKPDGSSPAPLRGGFLLPPREADKDTKSAVTTPAVPKAP